ncbi:MAG: RNA polymerase sigma factor [Candidatus Hydrogenedentes bacterium]|nr:RNA polymerase sigma factor [Candidatus Hydrogenedentota bacterium]
MAARTVAATTREATLVGQMVSDEELVGRTKGGEVEAFSELALRYQQIVYSLSYRFMRDAVSAEDMAQESFLKAYRHIRGFRGECSFSTWLYSVTCSVCLTELNRRKKRGEVELLPNHVGTARAAAERSFDLPDIVRECVGQLPDHYARVITLYYLQEAPYEEIAQMLGIPMGTLKTWMHRARRQLRRVVEKVIMRHGSETAF